LNTRCEVNHLRSSGKSNHIEILIVAASEFKNINKKNNNIKCIYIILDYFFLFFIGKRMAGPINRHVADCL